MEEKDIVRKIQKAFQDSTPDQFDEILSNYKERNEYKSMKKSKKWIYALSTVFAAVLLFIGLFSYSTYVSFYKVDTIIGLDVNPSIEIKVNKKDRVIKVEAKNEDAKVILKDMDLENTDIDVALNAIIGSMVTKGYLSELSNSILISVENHDEKKGEELRNKLSEKIESIIGTDKIQGSILSQNITEESKEARSLSDKYDISIGKATLILDICHSNPLLKEEELVDLSIHELNILSEGKSNNFSDIKKAGEASTKAYITKSKAKEIAFNHAKVKNPSHVEIEFDTEHGKLIYEIEFTYQGIEYEYEIDAKTGDILESKKEKEDDKPIKNESSNKITSSKAKEIAFNHAKVKNPSHVEIEFDKEDNEYSVEFKYNGYEYEYEIDAETGKILKVEKERD